MIVVSCIGWLWCFKTKSPVVQLALSSRLAEIVLNSLPFSSNFRSWDDRPVPLSLTSLLFWLRFLLDILLSQPSKYQVCRCAPHAQLPRVFGFVVLFSSSFHFIYLSVYLVNRKGSFAHFLYFYQTNDLHYEEKNKRKTVICRLRNNSGSIITQSTV